MSCHRRRHSHQRHHVQSTRCQTLTSFVWNIDCGILVLNSVFKKYIDILSETELKELENFLDFEDEILFNFYYKGTIEKKIDKNILSKKFKDFKV